MMGSGFPCSMSGTHTLLGSISKSDLILAIADRAKSDTSPAR